MEEALGYSYSRYLAAKVSVDDRAINQNLVSRLRTEFEGRKRLRILEIGGGSGSMLRRCLDWKLLATPPSEYTLVERDAQTLSALPGALQQQANRQGVSLQLENCTIEDFCRSGPEAYDLIIANAVLDLFDLDLLLPEVWRHCAEDALYWFTINFDGESTFLPQRRNDVAIWEAYHESMNRRAGSRYAGRQLFGTLAAQGAAVLASGSSDWVVHADADTGTYGQTEHGHEAYFLHHIVHTIDEELRENPPVPIVDFQEWIRDRHSDIERAEMVYIAHQLDFLGRAPR